jgi:hypothetical protein
MAWDDFRSILERLQNKSPESWSVEECHRLALAHFPSPGRFEESALFPLMMTISAIVVTLSGEINHGKIKETAELFIKKFGAPESLESQIVSLLVDASAIEPTQKEFVLGRGEEEEFEAFTQDGKVSLSSIGEKSQYFIWIDERQAEFKIDKNDIPVKPTPKRALIELLVRPDKVVTYKQLYQLVKSQKSKYKEIAQKAKGIDYREADRQVVLSWISYLHEQTNDILAPYIVCIPGEGYKFETRIKYCVIRRR